ncbi:hypothetical protein ACIQWV_36450 [Streptomyces sp. NPDC098085]|uniref:hypothetical protein n=1 Tax=Streptomyces sp. NPDC098085 TaxID=3366094 RepID=UPI00381F0CD5
MHQPDQGTLMRRKAAAVVTLAGATSIATYSTSVCVDDIDAVHEKHTMREQWQRGGPPVSTTSVRRTTASPARANGRSS